MPKKKKLITAADIDGVLKQVSIIETLKQATDEQIERELSRRQTERAQEARHAADLRQLWALEHVKDLLQLAPNHLKGGSCNDNELENLIPSMCTRCFLLRVLQEQYWHPSVDVRLTVCDAPEAP